MKTITIALIISALAANSYVNGQNIIWENSQGGIYNETAKSIIKINNGGFVIGATVESNTAPINNHHGIASSEDFWLYKLDSTGTLIWNKCFGGSSLDELNSVISTCDNGYCAVGNTLSQNFDVSGLHTISPWAANYDIWIMKTDSLGNLQWQKCIGGTGSEYAYYVEQTTDSGYVVIGETDSDDGDVYGFHGTAGLSTDIFLARLDKNGNLLWTKCYGSIDSDIGFVVKQTNDGGFLLGADVESDGGNISGHHGGPNGTSDIWVAKLSGNGNVLWSKCFGGTGYDQIYQILISDNGGFLLCSMSSSNDGDVSGQNGIGDFWLVNCDSIGNIQWQQCYGGSSYDYLYMAQRTLDGGIVMTGETTSHDGICSDHHPGVSDYLVVKVDSLGNYQWSKCLGGSADDYAYGLCVSQSGKIIVGGYTKSHDFDVSQNFGAKDSWVVALDDITAGVPVLNTNTSELIVNASQDNLNLQFYSLTNEEAAIAIYNLMGRIIFSKKITCIQGVNNFEARSEKLRNGIYMIQLVTSRGSVSSKFFVE